MKRTFPNQNKSAANCELHTEANVDRTKQISISGSSKACSSAAMIGLAAISTTMGASGILFSGENNNAVAAEYPQVDTNQQYSSSTVVVPELNVTGINTSKDLSLPKFSQYSIDGQGNSDSEVGLTQPETVLPSGQALEDQSFFPVELKQKNLALGKADSLPPLGALNKLQVKKAVDNDGQAVEQSKIEIDPVQPQRNPQVKSSVDFSYEESVSESVEKPSDLSTQKFRENTYQTENLVTAEPPLQIATPQVDNNSVPRQITEYEEDISQESIKTEEKKVEGAVVIDSEIASKPVSLIYRVRSGDTLSLIANQNNLSVKELAKANQIKDPNVIETAKFLKIPHEPSSSSLTSENPTTGNSSQLESYSSFEQQEDLSQPTLENQNNQSDFPEPKIITREFDYSSDSELNVTAPEIPITASSDNISWSQELDYEDSEIDSESEEFPISIQSIQENSQTTIEPKAWPDNQESKLSEPDSVVVLESQIHLGSNQSVQPLPVDRDTQDSELSAVVQTDNQENPYANRLRSEISRLQQEYDAQKDLEEPQITDSEPITIPVPQPLSLENNSSINHLSENQKRYLQPTYQLEISSSQARQFSEEIETNIVESRNPAKIVNPLPVASPVSQSQDLSTIAVAPIATNADEILNNPAIDKMVSPGLPPLGKADTYLPGGSMQFTGYSWPARGAMTSGYGPRWGRMHRGIDIAAPTGTPIVAAAPGEVTYADWNSGGYGYLVEIEHPNGSITVYAHNSEILVRKGQKVAQGELIAKMGSTGRSTGPHLHFEIHPKDSGAVNPMAYLPSPVASN
ncbi:peptidoglycan DD-metalloendopeptidase family protein [Okeania sp.]|uniref:peptidoglycan DD-metalloendopeptidase family protein n=1 Tax=Okeania sp. TaxID=3100323 RepID=UPI002B4B656B|nr:peptidoglycan DD-metalloendopeptidase family protein [Okeania sp.]MEB3342519.1 peptidoglycan DD-metalloendopeptidase family protein [Okeania sp.]